MEINNSAPTPSPTPTGAESTPVSETPVSNPTPTTAKPEKVSVPKAKEPVKAAPGLTPAQTAERMADIEAKVAKGQAVTDEDLIAFDAFQALEFEKAKNEKPEAPDADLENPELEEEISEENPEEVTEDEEAPTEIPEEYKEIFDLTGAKDPKQVAEKIKDYKSKIQFALDWKKKVDVQLKEHTDTISNREQALENQNELLAGVLQGDPEAIEVATSIMSQSGRNVHKPLQMPDRDSFVDQAAYDLFKQQQDALIALKAERDLEKAEKNKEIQLAQQRAANQEMLHNTNIEVSNLCDTFSDLGISSAQARAMLAYRLKTGKTPTAFEPIIKLMEFADKRKDLSLEEAYKILNYDKVAKGVPGKVKEQVKKILDPRKNQQTQPGLSGINPKAPPAPGGKLTREQVLGFVNTSNYPDAWMMTLSNGKKELDPNKIPPYVAAILESM